MAKYLVLDYFCYMEIDVQFYDTKEELLKAFSVKSIEQLVNKNHDIVVYEVNNVWECDK